MNPTEKDKFYAAEVEKLMAEMELSSDFVAQVRRCASIEDVISTLTTEDAEHVALLTTSSEPVTDVLGFSKRAFAEREEVAFVLLFNAKQRPVTALH